MKIFSILLLTAMVAIVKEKVRSEYLLVEVDDTEQRGRPGYECGNGGCSAKGLGGCKNGEVCCSCAPCREGDYCAESCREWQFEVPEKCYKNSTTSIDNTEIEKPVDYPKDPELCCKKQGVPENCLGLCKNVGSRSLSNEKSFTSACEQHRLTIMRCIVSSMSTEELKGDKQSRFGCKSPGETCSDNSHCCSNSCSSDCTNGNNCRCA